MKLSVKTLVNIFFILAIVLATYFAFEDYAILKFNSADASTYLNIAENISSHKGFVVSYNLYQSYATKYHPLWAYIHPLYPLVCSLVFVLHGGIEQVIKLNILIFGINAALIFYILQKLVPNPLNILFIFFLVISNQFSVSALYAWSEQFHLFCFIVSLMLFMRYKDRAGHLWWLGGINGIMMLIRAAHLYNFLAYLPVLFIGEGPWAPKFKKAFSFIAGFVLAYGIYQLFCLSVYHTFYPEYARAGVNYTKAHFINGIVYDSPKVGIQALLTPFFIKQSFLLIGQHLNDFYKQMPVFLWPALAYYLLPARKKLEGGLIELCFLQSIFTCLGYSLTFYWLAHAFEALRYSLIPFVLISIVGWYTICRGFQLSDSPVRKLICVLIFGWFFINPQIHKFIAIRNDVFSHPYRETTTMRSILGMYHWIDVNLPQNILVASTDNQHAYFMHRPYISLPPGWSYNCTNLSNYNRIYSPDYYVLSPRITDECFNSIPHTQVYSNIIFRLLKIDKDQTPGK